MTTIKDFESDFLSAKIEFDKNKKEFLAEFYAPVGREMMRAQIDMLSDEQKAQLRSYNPEMYDQMMKELNMEV